MFRRILGLGKPQPQPQRAAKPQPRPQPQMQAPRQPDRWLMLPKGHEIEVVGESFYQKELREIAGGLTADGAKNPTATATLFREPTNPYDKERSRSSSGHPR